MSRSPRAAPTTLTRAEELGLGDSYHDRCGGGGARRRPRHRLGAGRRVGRGRRGDRAGAEAGRHRHRCRLDQGARSSRRCSRTCRRASISSPAIRSPAPRSPGRMPALPTCSRTAGASSRRCPTPIRRRWSGCRNSGGAAAPTSTRWTPQHHDMVLAIVSHLPHIIAYNIVGTADDLRGGHQVGGHQILGLRLSRLHPPRRLRPDHVARRLPAQQGRDARNAGALLRGPRLAAAGDPLGRRRQAVRPVHPHPRRPPLDHRRRARKSTRRISAGRRIEHPCRHKGGICPSGMKPSEALPLTIFNGKVGAPPSAARPEKLLTI